MKKFPSFNILILLISLQSCGDTYQVKDGVSSFISTINSLEVKENNKGTIRTYHSTTAGNLITTAIKEEHNLDIVLYPQMFIDSTHHFFVHPNMNESEIKDVLSLYPKNSVKDQFMIGLMSGASLKHLIRTRVQDLFKLDLEVAGMIYRINSMAGVIQSESYDLIDGREFRDDQYYRVAISQYFYSSKAAFPRYRYRNGLSFSFNNTGTLLSARNSLKKYLSQIKSFDNLTSKRGIYTDYELKYAGEFKTYAIQSNRHRSPLWGKKVRTSGIITALSYVDWYPGGVDIIIQDPEGDGRDETSDALNLHLDSQITSAYLPRNKDGSRQSLKIGDSITVEGTVWEQMTLGNSQNMSKTVLRNITSIERKSRNHTLPAPVVLGREGRNIPHRVLSSWKGDLNFKTFLNLNDGIDFWESLEGMRVKVKNPRVVGFRGGNEDIARESAQSYISLFIVLDGLQNTLERTGAGGLKGDFILGDYSPEILHLSSGNLTHHKFIDTKKIPFDVGDIIQKELIGNISYESTIFGGGEYTLVIPEPQYKIEEKDILRRRNRLSQKQRKEGCEPINQAKIIGERYAAPYPVKCRPRTKLKGEGNKITVASYNLKNLSSSEDGETSNVNRLSQMGTSIRVNLNCPDILNLVEVQDDNGQDLIDGPGAIRTIKKIIHYSQCDQKNVDYQYINIDPLSHGEGGQPGGNIRVSMLYNKNRIHYHPWNNFKEENTSIYNRELRETTVDDNGNLSVNPGRVFPRAKAFQSTRKSIIAQFEFKGEKLFVIGNHLNSKLGDSSFWGAQQPPRIRSDERRIQTALLLSQFVNILNIKNNDSANIIVLGDFNAHYNERSMMALETNGSLTNMMYRDDLVPPPERYTHNYNGESSAIDFIFASKALMKKSPQMQVIHINTDYMGRLSDHDPVIAEFIFPSLSESPSL